MDKEARFFERIVRSHYWQKMPEIVESISIGNRTLFSKYKRIDAPLTDALIRKHRARYIILAHSLVSTDNLVPHILIEYNGKNPKFFLHHTRKILHTINLDDTIAFHAEEEGHLQLYIYVNNLPLQKAIEQGKIIDKELTLKLNKEWSVLPSTDGPAQYAIAQLPYGHFIL